MNERRQPQEHETWERYGAFCTINEVTDETVTVTWRSNGEQETVTSEDFMFFTFIGEASVADATPVPPSDEG